MVMSVFRIKLVLLLVPVTVTPAEPWGSVTVKLMAASVTDVVSA